MLKVASKRIGTRKLRHLESQMAGVLARTGGRENKTYRHLKQRWELEHAITIQISGLLGWTSGTLKQLTLLTRSHRAMIIIDPTFAGRFVTLKLPRTPFYARKHVDWVELVAAVPIGRYTIEEALGTFHGIAKGVLMFGGLKGRSKEQLEGIYVENPATDDGWVMPRVAM